MSNVMHFLIPEIMDEDAYDFTDEFVEWSDERRALYERYEKLREQLWQDKPGEPDIVMDYGVKFLPHDPYKKEFITHSFQNSRTGRYDVYNVDAVRVGTIGNPLILFGKYAIEQIWFPFVDAVLAHAPPTLDERKHQIFERRRLELQEAEVLLGMRQMREEGWNSVKDRADRPISIDRQDREMYSYDAAGAENQFVLPYKEFQRSDNLHHYTVRVWDQSPRVNGERQLLTIDISNLTTSVVEEWVRENTHGRFHINERGSTLTMEKYPEWLHARLRFQGGNKASE